MNLPTLVLLLLICIAPLASAQADGVTIEEQSNEGLDRQEAAIAAQVAALDKAGKLVGHKVLLGQIKNPTGTRPTLPKATTSKLSPAQVAELARVSTVRIGWAFLCERCNDWHLELAGGYSISADGAIATCAHVLEPLPMKKGSLIVVDHKGKVHPALSIVANDAEMDAAIVMIATGIDPLPFYDQVRPGDAAFCYSDPLDQRGYFSRGMVNRFLWQKIDRGGDDSKMEALRQLRLNVSTPWAPGSSGAPVLDLRGNVIGHVSLIETLSDGTVDAKRRDDSPATLSDIDASTTLITLHTAIPARSVKALAESIEQPKKNLTETEDEDE